MTAQCRDVLSVPYGAIIVNGPEKFIKPKYLPNDFVFQDPSKYTTEEIQKLLDHWKKRAEEGEVSFRFLRCIKEYDPDSLRKKRHRRHKPYAGYHVVGLDGRERPFDYESAAASEHHSDGERDCEDESAPTSSNVITASRQPPSGQPPVTGSQSGGQQYKEVSSSAKTLSAKKLPLWPFPDDRKNSWPSLDR